MLRVISRAHLLLGSVPAARWLRVAPALALLFALVGSAPAQAASTASATSPGPLTVTVGTGSPLPVIVGQPIAVGLSMTNTSAAPIGPFTFGVQVGPTAKLVASFPGVHVCAKPGNSFECTFAGLLQPGLTDNSFSFSVVPQQAGPIDITAFVAPTPGSSGPSNSVHLALPAVAATSDLQLNQTVSTAQPNAGALMTYTFQVKNTGRQAAVGATLSDTLPGDSTALGATASNGGGCTVSGQAVSCALGDVAASSSVTVTVSATAPTLFGTYTNTGSVSSASVDANPANNADSTTIRIR